MKISLPKRLISIYRLIVEVMHYQILLKNLNRAISFQAMSSFIWVVIYQVELKARLHSAIYYPDSFVLMLRYCANLKAIKYESTSSNRIVADKSHRVIVAKISTQTVGAAI